MRALKAHVRGGRLVLDDSERAELHNAILAAEAELDAGQAITEDDLWVLLRAIR